ncbi:MAG: response regulator [Deltaproteobacteria bacterium]|nr:response regulator [Deltaproteobacteria bacterium]
MPLDVNKRRQLLEIFREEAVEGLRVISRSLIACEQADSPEARKQAHDEVRRHLHSLKGSAAAVGLMELQALMHELETFLGPTSPEDGRQVDIALAAVETAEAWLQRGVAGEAISAEEVSAARQALTAPATAPAKAAASPPPAVAAPAPVASPVVAPAATSAAAPAALEPGREGGASPAPTVQEVAVAAAAPALMRVATERLDDLLGKGEELVVAGARLRPQVQRLADLAAEIEAVLFEVRRAERARRRGGERGGNDGTPLTAWRERLTEIKKRLTGSRFEVAADHERLSTLTTTLLDAVRVMRMLPVGEVLESYERAVRELARDQGKNVRMVVQCGDVRLDKRVLDAVRAPLLHLVRNAVAHGMETPSERLTAGKPPVGTLLLSSETRGNRVAIEVCDDGRGVDVDAVRRAATERGLVPAAAVASLSAADSLNLIFHPGLSTRREADTAAGRGVGLSVVYETMVQLRGDVRVTTTAGGGTIFSLLLPLTLAATRGLLVAVGGEVFALPVPSVERVLRVAATDVHRLQGRETIDDGLGPMPLVELASLLQRVSTADKRGRRAAVVVITADGRLALLVDKILDEHEIIMRDLPGGLSHIDVLAGGTLLEDGRVVPALNVDGLLRAAAARPVAATVAKADSRRIVVADDSPTTRSLIAGEVEAAGFVPLAAADGQQALQLLDDNDAVALISDVQMPNLDGLGLVRAVRANPRIKDLPVVLVTSRDSEVDRQLGAQAGADAYLIKKEITGERLLGVLGQLLRRSGRAT